MNDQTRREWVVTIGQSALGLSVAWRAQGRANASTLNLSESLPAGVYLPSTDHLSHALMSADRYRPIPAGCPTDYVRPSAGPYEPLFFSRSEFPVIQRLTQLLLGEASDGSAVTQEVTEWIDLVVSRADRVRQAEAGLDPLYRALAVAYFGPGEERGRRTDSAKACRDGLRWLRDEAHARYSREFLELTAEQQKAILHSASDERPNPRSENGGTRLFAFLKAETANGFYTSRTGLAELSFKGNAFYARSPGCQSQS